ncbi:Tgs1 protein [Phlebopus sp. FC_14]|nr:Tgs1 protein [Phlebopus sp. FC_14]
MGKRTKNLSGLSYFAKQSFQTNAAANPSSAVERDSNQAPQEKEIIIPQRTVLANPDWRLLDATSLVPHYKSPSEVPEHLQKYFAQRKRYFALYEKGCLLDEEGWYSVTPELIADRVAERCRCDTVLDAFCGVGGNAIAFAKTCEHVIAMDICPTKLALARHNAVIYGVADRIEFVLADFISFANAYLSRPVDKRNIEVVFLSPPWGGPAYISQNEQDVETVLEPSNSTGGEQHPEYSLSSIKPIHGAELFRLTRQITKNVAYFLPRNTSLGEISTLLTESGSDGTEEMVEVEEQWMGTKLKALTCYFGGLADGQEHLF